MEYKMSKKELTPEEKKALLLKKKKAALLKKKEEESTSQSSKTEDDGENLKLLTDKERLALGKELKENALATFAKFDFYKDGYKKTLGIIAFTALTCFVSLYALIYAQFIYAPQSAYLVTNSKGQVLEPTSLALPLYRDVEIIDFATQAYRDINSYNYVSLKNNYFPNLLKHYTEKSLTSYQAAFTKTAEMAYVTEHRFIVESVIFKGATIDLEASKKWTKKARGVKMWEVVLHSVKIYQNEKSYVRKQYETRIRVSRVSSSKNENRIAIHSFVDKEINKKK